MGRREFRVFVYRNLNRGGFSVRGVASGLVVAHAEGVQLADARFRVGEGGRARVLRTGTRNVHAGVEGDLVIDPALMRPRPADAVRVRYSPFESAHFVDERGACVMQAPYVWLEGGKVYIPCRK